MTRSILTDCGLTILVLICMVTAAWAGQSKPEVSQETASQTLMAAPIRFFQTYLSRADGHRCPMTPSCSQYALQAIQRHGALKGWIMSCDRLLRCGRDELHRSPSVRTRQGVRCQDPLSSNDVWRP